MDFPSVFHFTFARDTSLTFVVRHRTASKTIALRPPDHTMTTSTPHPFAAASWNASIVALFVHLPAVFPQTAIAIASQVCMAPICAQQWISPQLMIVPAATVGHGLAHDSARGVTIKFGGESYVSPSTANNDTWEWNGASWALMNIPMASRPSARSYVYYVYDSMRGKIVMYGGYNAPQALGDTWEYDGATSTWSLRNPALAPSPRWGAGMAYDSVRGRTVLYGGRSTWVGYDDTWEWDGTVWHLMATPPPPNRPPALHQPAMAFDPVRGVTVLFGGLLGGGPTNQTWEWNGVVWKQAQPPASPPVSANGGLVWHASIGQVVFIRSDPSDVWTWDGALWRKRCASGPHPAWGISAAAYDGARNHVVMFGGIDAMNQPMTDTWLYDAGDPQLASATRFGQGCPGSIAVPDLNALNLPVPTNYFRAELTGFAPGLVFFGIGMSNTLWGLSPLPVSLGAAGLGSQCIGYISFDAMYWTYAASRAQYQLLIPCNPALYGLTFYMQAGSVDASILPATPIGIALSNGLRLQCGI
jgi:hypothetical protein